MLEPGYKRPSSHSNRRAIRTSGNLNTLGLKVLGVTRGLAVPLSELLAVVQLQDTHRCQPSTRDSHSVVPGGVTGLR